MSILTSVINQEYAFRGSCDYSKRSLESLSTPSALENSDIPFNGSFYPDKLGFFKKGLFEYDGSQYDMVGHLHRNKDFFTHLIFLITPDKSINQHWVYSLLNTANSSIFNHSRSTKNIGLDGIFVGGWCMNFYNLKPELFNNYDYFKNLADCKSPIEGDAGLELKRSWDINMLGKDRAGIRTIDKKTYSRSRVNGLALTIKSLSEECTDRLTSSFKKAGKDVDIMGYVPIDLSKANLDSKGTLDMWDTVHQYAMTKFGKDCELFALHPHDSLPGCLRELMNNSKNNTGLRYFVICKQN